MNLKLLKRNYCRCQGQPLTVNFAAMFTWKAIGLFKLFFKYFNTTLINKYCHSNIYAQIQVCETEGGNKGKD